MRIIVASKEDGHRRNGVLSRIVMSIVFIGYAMCSVHHERATTTSKIGSVFEGKVQKSMPIFFFAQAAEQDGALKNVASLKIT